MFGNEFERQRVRKFGTAARIRNGRPFRDVFGCRIYFAPSHCRLSTEISVGWTDERIPRLKSIMRKSFNEVDEWVMTAL